MLILNTIIMDGQYTCETCKYATDNESYYKKHLNTKAHLLNNNGDIDKFHQARSMECKFCKMIYKDKNHINTHYAKCRAKEIVEKYEAQIDELKEEKIEKYEKQLEKVNKKLTEIKKKNLEYEKEIRMLKQEEIVKYKEKINKLKKIINKLEDKLKNIPNESIEYL